VLDASSTNALARAAGFCALRELAVEETIGSSVGVRRSFRAFASEGTWLVDADADIAALEATHSWVLAFVDIAARCA